MGRNARKTECSVCGMDKLSILYPWKGGRIPGVGCVGHSGRSPGPFMLWHYPRRERIWLAQPGSGIQPWINQSWAGVSHSCQSIPQFLLFYTFLWHFLPLKVYLLTSFCRLLWSWPLESMEGGKTALRVEDPRALWGTKTHRSPRNGQSWAPQLPPNRIIIILRLICAPLLLF